jgi:hypothetical protein
MKTLKILALVSFIVMCMTITFVNISTPVNAKPYVSNGISATIGYETKYINGRTICVVKYGSDIEVVSW